MLKTNNLPALPPFHLPRPIQTKRKKRIRRLSNQKTLTLSQTKSTCISVLANGQTPRLFKQFIIRVPEFLSSTFFKFPPELNLCQAPAPSPRGCCQVDFPVSVKRPLPSSVEINKANQKCTKPARPIVLLRAFAISSAVR